MPTGTIELVAAESLERAVSRTREFGDALAKDFPALSLRDVLAILRELKRRLRPPRPPSRRNTKRITVAHADWKAGGLRGVALYEKHIPGFRKMGYWKKKDKIRTLMDAIRKREKRERRRTKSKSVLPNKSLP